MRHKSRSSFKIKLDNVNCIMNYFYQHIEQYRAHIEQKENNLEAT